MRREGDSFFDDGVLAYDIDVNGWGLDCGDFDGALRDLVVEALLGENHPHDEVARRIFYSVEYEDTNDGRNDVIRKAMWHYDNVA